MPASRAGDGGHRGILEGRLRPDARPRRHVGPVRLRQPLRLGAAPRRCARRDPLRGRRGRLRRRAHAARRAARLRDRVQLEGLRRQLPRGLPPADRAPAALQGARLRLLPRGGVPLLLEAARADPRAEAGRGARGGSALPPPARRGGLGPLLLALPEHDVQHLPGQHVLERHPAAGRRPHADDLRVVLRRARFRPRLGVDAADDRLLRRDPAGGHRHLRAGPARPPLTLVRGRPLLRQARERRLPLPEPRPRVPRRDDAPSPEPTAS